MFDETIRRQARAAVFLVAGAGLALAVFAADWRAPAGPVALALGLAVATFGALDLAGAFEARIDDDAIAIPLAALATPTAGLLASLVVFVLALREAAAGVLRIVPAAVLVPASFLLVLASLHAVTVALGSRQRLVARPGFWILVVATLLYLPLLGATGLVDPWESHYGEVAREMIARDDWISPWWAQDRWFWSKPVLDLWLEALSMRALGVHAQAGAMLAPMAGVTPRPEWALRLPAFLAAVAGLYVLYKGVARAYGARAGVLAALVLATMPQFFLMARQATTDMPLVGTLAATLGLLMLASAVEPRERAPSCAVRVGRRVLHLRAVQLVLAGAVLVILPQALYLVSRSVTLHLGPAWSIHAHADAFWSGSPGNCDVPGNAACAREAPLHPTLPPALQAVPWVAALAVIVASNSMERRLARVAYLGAFLFAALATMAKGPLGVALPAVACLATLVVMGRLERLVRIPIASGTLLVVAATLPWYVAELSRHGAAFTDELVFRNMIGRATSHLHDTNVGDDVSFRYYLWQLGYAIFPWVGLAPTAFALWPSADASDPRGARRRREARALALLWIALAFALFTVMPTKFHHYIFPVLPACALLIGLLLDELVGAAPRVAGGALGAAMLGGAALVLLVARDLATPGVAGEARLLNLVTYNYARSWPEWLVVRGALLGFGVLFAALVPSLGAARVRRAGAIGLLGAALAFAVWGGDVYLPRLSPHWSQRELVEAYHRARTTELDPLAAWNMNWKGENFYSGNHVAVFPAGGRVATWLEARRREGARAAFFLTEHGRLGALKNEVGAAATVTPLTTSRDDNKFVLAKVTWE